MRNVVIGVFIGLLVGVSAASGQMATIYIDVAKWIQNEGNTRNTTGLVNTALHTGYTAGLIDTINAIAAYDKVDVRELQRRIEVCLDRSNIRGLGDVSDFAERAMKNLSPQTPMGVPAAFLILGKFNQCGQ